MKDPELIKEWLIKARHDLDSARLISEQLPDYYDMIAFHCQQSIEKSIKAYLIFLDIEYKPVHDLGYLLNLLETKDNTFEIYYNKVDEISRYAVQIRYPDSILELSKQQIHDAIQLAEELYTLILSKSEPK
jgi:HEPN domain-containing protein